MARHPPARSLTRPRHQELEEHRLALHPRGWCPPEQDATVPVLPHHHPDRAARRNRHHHVRVDQRPTARHPVRGEVDRLLKWASAHDQPCVTRWVGCTRCGRKPALPWLPYDGSRQPRNDIGIHPIRCPARGSAVQLANPRRCDRKGIDHRHQRPEHRWRKRCLHRDGPGRGQRERVQSRSGRAGGKE